MNDRTNRTENTEALPSDLVAIASGLDAVAETARREPDSGFEARIASRSLRQVDGAPALRLTGHPEVHVAARRTGLVLRLAAAVLIAGGGLGLAWTWLSGSPSTALPSDAGSVTVASATDAEISEIADAWDALDDDELLTRFEDVSSRLSMVSDSVGGSWTATWSDDDSM